MVVLTLEGNSLQIREIKGRTLDAMYKYIECTCVDCRTFKHKGVEYDVWFDDEFLFNNKPNIVTLTLGKMQPNGLTVICGNLFFAKHDAAGKTIGLSDEEILDLKQFMDTNIMQTKEAMQKGFI